jgi:uncharacterized SAM-binding protein YcdF (DUF218 family)
MNKLTLTKSNFLFAGVILAFFILLFFAIRSAGTFLVKSEQPRNAFPALILMGSIPDRALAAIDLYKAGKIKNVIIVEENMQGLIYLRQQGFKVYTNSEQMLSLLVQAGISDSLITIIPGMARSTLMEAQAYDRWLASNPLAKPDTLLLISSAAHMRRASLIFNHVLNRRSRRNIYIATFPSPYSGYNAQSWYTSKEDIQTTLSECLKIVSFQLVERWQ